MVHGFDIRALIKATIKKILGISLPIVIYTDLKLLYDCLIRLGTTQEKRLIVDIIYLRQAYERREITKVKWIDGDTNLANSITKAKPLGALKLLLNINKV